MTHTNSPLNPGTFLTQAEASAVTGVDESTITRDRKAGRYPGAFQDQTPLHTWRIPVTDLVDARRLSGDQVSDVHVELAARRESRLVAELRELVVRLETQHVAQAELLAERAADIAFLRTQLKRANQAVA